MTHHDGRPDALPEDPHPDEGQVGITPQPTDVPVVPEGDTPETEAERGLNVDDDPHEADLAEISFTEEKRYY